MIKRIAIFLSVVIFLTPMAAMGFSVDLYNDFPDNQGDNGFYAQGFVSSSSTFYNLDDVGSYDFGNSSRFNYLPRVVRATFPEIFMNPIYASGPIIEQAVLTWDVPTGKDGDYNISAQFRMAGLTEDGVVVKIFLNNNWSSPLFVDALTFLGDVASFTTPTPIALSDTDVVRFFVDGINNSNSDWTMLQGQISGAAPIPGSLLLLGSGILGIISLRRKL